jgi:hypothetical protein
MSESAKYSMFSYASCSHMRRRIHVRVSEVLHVLVHLLQMVI